MADELKNDFFFIKLCQGYTQLEVAEIENYLKEWDASTYISKSQSILDHTARKEFDPLKYLRKAHNFNKKGSVRVPKTGYRTDGEHLIFVKAYLVRWANYLDWYPTRSTHRICPPYLMQN